MENIYNLTKEDLESYLININDKKFRSTQIYDWLYVKRVKSRSQRIGRGLHRLQRHRLCRGSVPVSTGDQRDVPWNVPFLSVTEN